MSLQTGCNAIGTSSTGGASKRFCSCSEFPAHLAAATFDSGNSGVAIDSENESAVRFCSCSILPPHLMASSAVSDASSRKDEQLDVGDDSSQGVYSEEEESTRGLLDLLPEEKEILSEQLDAGGGGELIFTDRRVILKGGAESRSIFSSMRVDEIETVALFRVLGGRSALYWSIIGAIASVAMWQSLDGIGNLRLIITALVAVVSVGMLILYLVQPSNVLLAFRSIYGSELSAEFTHSKIDHAEQFAAQVLSRVEDIRSKRDSAHTESRH